MNTGFFVGNLTRAPEVKYLDGGRAVCNFGLAVDDPYIKNGEEVKNTQFLDFVAFGFAANTVGSLNKGDRVVAVASVKKRSFEHDGQKRTATELLAQEVGVIRSKAARGDVDPSNSAEAVPVGADDIPF